MPSFAFQTINRTFFLSWKPLNMLGRMFASKYFSFTIFFSLTCRCFSSTYLIAFSNPKTLFVLCFLLYDHCWPFLLLILRFLNAKYIHCAFLVCSQSSIIQLLLFCNHFNIEKHQRNRLCCLLLSKYVLCTVF